MIKIGNMLIDPNDVSSIHRDMKPTFNDKERGFCVVQIIYKNGVVKNITTAEIGVNSYDEFISEFLKQDEKKETDHIFRLMTALNSVNNG